MVGKDYNLPEDLLIAILLWLPVKSLSRFKAVCKSWCSLFQNSSFIAQHLHLHRQHNCYADIIMKSRVHKVGNPNFSLHSGKNLEMSKNLALPRFFNENYDPIAYGKIIASCNGIICLHHYGNPRDVSLWNPATKQFRILPNSSLRIAPADEDDVIDCGFGLDVETDDYKVVRFVCENADMDQKERIEVYSLSSDSWRTLDVVLPVNSFLSNPKAPYQNGVYCWLGIFDNLVDDSLSYKALVSFDFHHEVFTSIPLPDFGTRCDSWTDSELFFLREKIACIHMVDDSLGTEDYQHYHIWVLNEFGVKESWTRLNIIGPFTRSLPKGVSENGKIILIANSRLWLCDPITQEMNCLTEYVPHRIEVVVYRESLVPIFSRKDTTNRVSGRQYPC